MHCAFELVYITNFSIIIGSPRAYLSGDWRNLVSNFMYRHLITTYCTWISLTGNLRDLHVNYSTYGLEWFSLLFVKRPENTLDLFT